ncbi:stAR-related lipid transfer protein 9 [Trichinella spiralis]|uniref:stAR-related lipid transfer protein 9 n=1 Tax=Trichinella spiralis TaxID=6334 RepID=UPI0001EFC4F3|nr:stAR-related lipid transfer protein 9 [Trichinella spiralis]
MNARCQVEFCSSVRSLNAQLLTFDIVLRELHACPLHDIANLFLLNAEWEHNLKISIFPSSDMKQRDCGKLAAAFALYHFDPNCSVDINSSCKYYHRSVAHNPNS